MPWIREFRSGPLTERRLERVLGWVKRIPNDLKRVAQVCQIHPDDLLYWYAAGQAHDCPDPIWAELAFEVANIRGERAARNWERLEAKADSGDIKAIELIDKRLDASAFEISPTGPILDDLIHALHSDPVVPKLPSGERE